MFAPCGAGKRLQERPRISELWTANYPNQIFTGFVPGGFLLVTWVATKAVFFLLHEAPVP